MSFPYADLLVVDVRVRRRRLACPECGFSTVARYDTRRVSSSWRHLDFGRWRVTVRAGLRRLACPDHGVRVEAVPFARHRSGFTRDFEDLIAYLATKTDKTTITRRSRVDWDSVGRVCERVVADGLDPGRLDGLVAIGVDEVSWKRHHNYLTLVTDHTGKKIVWGAEGKDTATLDAFFAELGAERAVAGELAQRLISEQLARSEDEPTPAWDELRAGFAAYLDACLDSDFQRIVLIDGPAVLGPDACDALVEQHGLGLLRDWLHQAIDGGQIDPLPIDPLARVLAALFTEASLYIARAPNPAEAREQTGHTLDRILLGLRPSHD